MARRKTTPVQTQTVQTTVDLIANLLTELNTISGIDFVEDAWVEKAPDNYGVVELTGQNGSEYADGKLVEQSFGIRISIYVSGGSHSYIEAVQNVLTAFDIGFSMPTREYLQDINKVSWVWNCTLFGPIEYTVETEVETPQEQTEKQPSESGGD